MKNLRITVADRVATYAKRYGAIICGNSDYKVAFTFDSEWDEITEKTARFIWGGQYYDVEFNGTECDVPIIMSADEVEVGVYAGELQTTTGAKIPCQRSILSGTNTAQPEQAADYRDQAVAAAKRAEEAAEKAAEEAAAALESAEKVIVDMEELKDSNGQPYLRLNLLNGAVTEVPLDDVFQGKQETLPVNEGSSSHRMWVAAPQGFTDEDGNEVKYHLKRIAGYDSTNKTASNGNIGIVTKANRDTKVAQGIIEENDGAYENYVEHDELTPISIACRDKMGRLVIEDGTQDFHAVNKRQLDKKVNALAGSYKVYGKAKAGTDMLYPIDISQECTQGNIVRRQTNGHIYVPLASTSDAQATSKKYVDGVVEDAKAASKKYVDEAVKNASGGSYWDFTRYASGYCEGETPVKVHLEGVPYAVAQILVVYDFNGYTYAGGAYIYGSNSNEGSSADWHIDNKWGYCANATIEGNYGEQTVDIHIPHSDDGSCNHIVYIKVLHGEISSVSAEYNIG